MTKCTVEFQKNRVLALFRDNWTCHMCGYSLEMSKQQNHLSDSIIEGYYKYAKGGYWEVDHIIPQDISGDDSLNNLQVLCKPCHIKKTSKDGTRHTNSQFRRLWRNIEEKKLFNIV
jgi:5-methylcytosine-specific restriction endonuclease McrA